MIVEKVHLHPLKPSDSSFDAVVKLFCESFFDGTYSNEKYLEVKENIVKHSKYTGFKGLVAFNSKGDVVGFVYGYASLPGQFYHSRLEEALEENKHEWITHAFELVQLTVDPSYRRRRIAGHLLEGLIKLLPCEKVVASIGIDNVPAQQFYFKNGFTVIEKEIDVIPGIGPQMIMAKRIKEKLD